MNELPNRKTIRLKNHDYSSAGYYFITICTKDKQNPLGKVVDPTKSVVAKVVNAFKSLTSRRVGGSMWQRAYHDRIIRNEKEYMKIWSYIDGNPAIWADDCYYISSI